MARKSMKDRGDIRVEFGAPNTIRTCDPRLRRAVLYPAELWAQMGLHQI